MSGAVDLARAEREKRSGKHAAELAAAAEQLVPSMSTNIWANHRPKRRDGKGRTLPAVQVGAVPT